nr:TolC family protein [Acinetobacter pittii]
MIAAQAGIEVAKAQKEQTRLTRYPTLAVKGSLSQAINGKNPNNDEDDGLYSSIMLEATSQFYQGGAVSSQVKMASYAEEAAKSKVNSVYLDVLDQIRTSREQIENKQRQMQVLANRQATTVRTRELYQEQYKLGTRSLVDLLMLNRRFIVPIRNLKLHVMTSIAVLFSTLQQQDVPAKLMT